MKMILNLIRLIKDYYCLRKIVNHINISLGTVEKYLVILIEKEYILKTDKKFFLKLVNEIKKKYIFVKFIEYSVDLNLKKTTYFYKKKSLSTNQLEKLFKTQPKFIDFIYTGRAFYKKNPLQNGLIIVRLSEKNKKIFSYGKILTKILNKKSLITIKYLEQINQINSKSFSILIPRGSVFYPGFGSSQINSSKPNFRILPIDTISCFLKNPNSIPMKKSRIVINGKLNKYGYIEDINKGHSFKGKISLSVYKNRITKLKVNSKLIRLDKQHKIVHLTFGINPFIYDNFAQITDYERSSNYICIGVEDSNKSHIDICLNIGMINFLHLICFTIKQKITNYLSLFKKSIPLK